ncbi:MAG TPA: DUF1735 domain-containing protein, partial [Chitinophagaceae bacterium]|nr:DUF1735 domain-containing protein [Chitinophagaceae bacterium]
MRKLFNLFTLAGLTSLLLASCIKDEVKDLTTEGDTFLKFLEAPEKVHYFSPFTDVKTVDLFSLRKDANSQSSLNMGGTVKLERNDALVDSFNSHNNESYELLPDSLYTLASPAFTKTAAGYDVTFAPGDFSKELTIQLNGAKWDIAHKYALGFTIVDSANMNVNEGKRDIVVMIAVKNKYDGIYRLTGFHNRPTLDFPYDTEVHLITAGPNSVIFYWPLAGSIGHPIGQGPDNDLSWYGASIAPVIVFDPATDLVTEV